jgi:hypothetical protein
MLGMGRGKSGGLGAARSAGYSTKKEGGFCNGKTEKGVAHMDAG